MTQDEIIEMAQKCGLIGMRPHLDGIYSEALIAFANLVAAKEREACAKVVDDWSDWHGGTELIAAIIRERGQT
jgi:hypothetical protein